MSSIRTEWVALDTNEYIFGIRGNSDFAASEKLLTEGIASLRVMVPLQVLTEVSRNLSGAELKAFYQTLESVAELAWDFSPPEQDLVLNYVNVGAKKGDAVIAAHLDSSKVPWLISENRHFLSQIPNLPFKVITASEALSMLSM
jgi:hypothetical protein